MKGLFLVFVILMIFIYSSSKKIINKVSYNLIYVIGVYGKNVIDKKVVKTKLSHIIGRKAADYLNSGADKIEAGTWADAHHALSEGWGFILSLQFTRNPETGSPYYSNAEVNSMLSDIDDFWTVTPANLRTMASGIESKFGF